MCFHTFSWFYRSSLPVGSEAFGMGDGDLTGVEELEGKLLLVWSGE